MIILDTNIVSEALREQCNFFVDQWLDEQIIETLYTTSVNLAELWGGIKIMPDGKRKTALENGLNTFSAKILNSRILPFDDKSAMVYAELNAHLRSNGVSISFPDGQIAAIALVHGFKIATRDTLPFEAAGIKVINPWIWSAT